MKKIFSIMILVVFLTVNTITVSAAEVMSPAKPITNTQLYIYEITSEKAGQEIIYGNNGINMDHGGTWLQITLVETGTIYKTLQVSFNGSNMIMTDSAEMDINGDGIIDKRISIWRYDGVEFENGAITITATASTYPWNTISYRYMVF